MYLQMTEVRTLPFPPHRFRRVFCVIEHEHQSREIADAACEGIFTNAGQTIRIGTPIAWQSPALPADEEWAIEWYKFYFGLDLAHAFSKTGDAKYFKAWQAMVRSWIGQMTVGCDSSDVAARRISNWIYTWNIFSASSAVPLSISFESELIQSLEAHVSHVRRNLTKERNHRTLELYALFIAALAVPELDQSGRLLESSIERLHENLLRDVLPDGVHREQSTHYHMTALRSFLGARENARLFGLSLPFGYDERLLKACEFALHAHRPDGFIPALSDSDTGTYLDLLKLAGELFDRPDFTYVATRGAEGSKPNTAHASFPCGGYFIQRSGWGDRDRPFRNERYLIFDCGPLGDGGHGHYDLLNVEIAANGRSLIVDPGRYTYVANDDGNGRRRFKGTAAHNTVCVDGLDQTAFYAGKPKGAVATGELIGRITQPGFDMLCGSARTACYDTIHTRRIFFIAGEYWLIVDSLRSQSPHTFDLRFHLTPDAWNHCALFTSTENSIVRTPEMALLFEPRVRPVIKAGWVSPVYGVKHQAPVVSVKKTNQIDTDFISLVFPTDLKTGSPRFRASSRNNDYLSCGLVEVEKGHGHLDRIAWRENGAAWKRTFTGGRGA